MAKKVIFATSNEGKMKEVRSILEDLGMEVLSMKEAGINVDVVEDGTTFEENAVIKATEIQKVCGEIVLADDSGLEVDYLNKNREFILQDIWVKILLIESKIKV